MHAYYRIVGLALLLTVLLPGCGKFLAKNVDSSVQQAHTVADFQAIMDNNVMTAGTTPGLGPLYVDDYTIEPAAQPGLDAFSIAVYTWQPSLLTSNILPSWSYPYDAINYCNDVLTELPGLTDLDSTDVAGRRFVLGQAYYLRAFLYYNLEETFGQPYREASSSTDHGVPLRISENVQPQAPRATVAEVYQQIVSDLNKAAPLLPTALQVANRNRPCRAAAYGLLARVWLTRQDYAQAAAYADSCLSLYDSLVDYNSLDSTRTHPFPPGGNSEVLFQCWAENYPLQYAQTTLVDSTLYSSYSPDDLRRSIFFLPITGAAGPAAIPAPIPAPGASSGMAAGYSFKGQYSGRYYIFSGIAVDEVFLIRAESRAWIGDIAGAMADVNALLVKRWRKGRFTPYTAATQDAALRIVLSEKRKETLFREGRFYDLRRLNQNPAYADTMSRVYGGTTYTLLPGSPRYAFPIPQQEIDLDGEVQNPE